MFAITERSYVALSRSWISYDQVIARLWQKNGSRSIPAKTSKGKTEAIRLEKKPFERYNSGQLFLDLTCKWQVLCIPQKNHQF